MRVRDGKTLTTDGPFAETKEQLGGYYLVEAKDLDEATKIAARIPSAQWRQHRGAPGDAAAAGLPAPAPHADRSAPGARRRPRLCCAPRADDAGRDSRRQRSGRRVFREERGRILATLIRLLGDIDLAEEALAAALEAALVQWPRAEGGMPDNPRAWLIRTARNKAIDRRRRGALVDEKRAELAAEAGDDAVAAAGLR